MHQAESTNITIFTDMSAANGLVGYCFYLRSNYGQYKQTGCFEGLDMNSFKSELFAIGKALQYAKHSHWNKKVNKVYIYCDNQGSVDALINYSKGNPIKNKDKEFTDRLKAFLDDIGYVIEARKVKAHTNGKTIQKNVNRWMDKEARAARKEKENKLGGYTK